MLIEAKPPAPTGRDDHLFEYQSATGIMTLRNEASNCCDCRTLSNIVDMLRVARGWAAAD